MHICSKYKEFVHSDKRNHDLKAAIGVWGILDTKEDRILQGIVKNLIVCQVPYYIPFQDN